MDIYKYIFTHIHLHICTIYITVVYQQNPGNIKSFPECSEHIRTRCYLNVPNEH